MVIFIVITLRTSPVYILICMFASFYIRHTHTGHKHSFSSQTLYTDFKCHFWFTSTECSILVPSESLPWICDHQWYLYRGFEASDAFVLWNDAPASWVAVHRNWEKYLPERCSDLFEDCQWSSICWNENSQRVIGTSYFRINICCL